MSDYSWGWVVFHYGRWVWIGGVGWAWVPGRSYAPAWVVWRIGDPGYDYVGWAPMPPTFVWFGGVAVWYVGVVSYPWWFVESHWLFHVHVHRHVLPPLRAAVISRRTHVHRRHRPATVGPRDRPRAPPATTPPRRPTPTPRKLTPSSPTFREARLPANARPKQRTKPNTRALSHSRRSQSELRGVKPRPAPPRVRTPTRRKPAPSKAPPASKSVPRKKAPPPRRRR